MDTKLSKTATLRKGRKDTNNHAVPGPGVKVAVEAELTWPAIVTMNLWAVPEDMEFTVVQVSDVEDTQVGEAHTSPVPEAPELTLVMSAVWLPKPVPVRVTRTAVEGVPVDGVTAVTVGAAKQTQRQKRDVYAHKISGTANKNIAKQTQKDWHGPKQSKTGRPRREKTPHQRLYLRLE